MDHREAEKLLLDYVDGILDRITHNAVMSHIRECVDCRAWLETHELLASTSEVCRGDEHLDRELQALLAVFPEEENELGRIADSEHLESCGICQRELNLVRDAVVEARSEARYPSRVARPKPRFSLWYAAAAACVIAVAVKVIVPSTSLYFDSDVSRPNGSAMTIGESVQTQTGSSGTAISEEEIGGTRIIQAEGRLTMSDVKIMDGARVTIHANEVVAFGNGFQVGRQTELTVGATNGRPVRKQ